MQQTERDAVASRLAAVEAQLAFQRLAADYCHGADAKQVERFMSVWHPDATWEIVGEPAAAIAGSFVGHEAIREGIENIWVRLPRTFTWMVNLAVDLNDPEHATGVANTTSTAFDEAGGALDAGTTLEDEYERRDGVWRYSRRRLIVLFLDRRQSAAG